MKKTLLFLLLAVLHVSAYGQAKIVFESNAIDVGDIDMSKKPLKAEFKFKNEGNESLYINRVTSAYPKFTVNYPQTPIAPDQEGVITVEGRFSMPGNYTKTITVRSSGQIEMTRLRLSFNNTSESYVEVETDELVQGGSFNNWLKNNVKNNVAGIDKNITYYVKTIFNIDNKGKIVSADFNKKNLPQPVINEINRLVTSSPIFTADHYGKNIEKVILINQYHYSNPSDKAYDIVSNLDHNYIFRQVNGSLADLNTREIHDNYIGVKVDFIIERDGSITNLMSEIHSNSSAEYVSHVKEAIKKVALVGKTKPGIANGKNCRTRFTINVLYPKNK